MDLKEIVLDCADKKCSSRKRIVLRFCCHKNVIPAFKRKADFVKNIYLPRHISNMVANHISNMVAKHFSNMVAKHYL